MRVLSLFSGIGGFDLGFQLAGMDVVGMCEIDRHAQKVLKRHFPNATLHGDVRDVSYERGTIDLVCGGFPCQDISVAGKRKGLHGDRSGLWFRFADIIAESLPLWVVIENVQGLLTSNNGHDFGVILHWLAQHGYGVGWRVLDSQGFGLAQRRKRVFIVASLGTPSGCTVLLERESVPWHNRTGNQKKQANTRTTNAGSKCGGGETIKPVDFVPYSIIDGNTTQNGSGVNTSNLSYTLTSRDKHSVGVLWESTHTDDPVRVCTNQSVSPTLQARMGTGGNSTPMIGVRRLTPTECERLQGFPDGWTDGQSDAQRYKQLGNAVSVPVAQWIGNKIMEAHSGN
jgi:DNA (cytosine-5)-methyltransferase 1